LHIANLLTALEGPLCCKQKQKKLEWMEMNLVRQFNAVKLLTALEGPLCCKQKQKKLEWMEMNLAP